MAIKAIPKNITKKTINTQIEIAVLNESPNSILVINKNWIISYANKMMCELLKKTKEEIVNHSWSEIFPQYSLLKSKGGQRFLKRLWNKKLSNKELTINLENNRKIYFFVTTNNFTHENKEYKTFSISDVTEAQKNVSQTRQFQKNFYRDMHIARNIQKHLNHSVVSKIESKGFIYHFGHVFMPSSYLSGDILNINNINREYLSLFIGDGRGHGLPAALYSALVYSYLNVLSNQVLSKQYSLKNIVKKINEIATTDFKKGEEQYFFSGIFSLVNTKTDTIAITNAGHPPGYMIKRQTIKKLENNGPIIGVDIKASFSEYTYKVEGGELFFLYTDGLSDIQNANNDYFGDYRIYSYLKGLARSGESPLKFHSKITQLALDFAEGNAINDDISILTMYIEPKEKTSLTL